MFLSQYIRILVLLLVFFLFPQSVSAQSTSLVFSEIAAYETNDDTHSEWVEIFNRSASSVDIAGWSFVDSSGDKHINHSISVPAHVSSIIEPQTYAIIAQNRDVFLAMHPDVLAPVFDSSWGSLNESGEHIALLDANGNVVESFTYGIARDHSLERVDVASGDASNVPWVERDGHTAGLPFLTAVSVSDDSAHADSQILNVDDAIEDAPITDSIADEPNISALESVELPSASTPSVDEAAPPAREHARTTTRGWGAVRLNELVSDPTTYDSEWIELVNMIDEELDLSGWHLVDGSGRMHTLDGMLPAAGFRAFSDLSFKLNNHGDEIRLQDQWGFVIDRMSYGTWIDDVVDDNAPTARANESIARRRDGISTVSDKIDFATTITPTRGFANRIEQRPTPVVMDRTQTRNTSVNPTSVILPDDRLPAEAILEASSPRHTLLLSELMPNPAGPDTENEFIELHNPTNEDVKLSGWRLMDDSGTSFTFASTTIAAHMHLIARRSETGISLNNSKSETITLFRPDSSTSDRVTYDGSVGNDWSYARDNDSWTWTTVNTPGLNNMIAQPNLKPIATLTVESEIDVGTELVFDASDSFDPNDDPLRYTWSFGDRTPRVSSTSSTIAHTYDSPGTYTARVSVSDGFATSSVSAPIVVIGERVSVQTPTSSATPSAPRATRTSVMPSRSSFRTVSLDVIDSLETGTRIITEGTVLAEPGVLGAQIFYIGHPGVEIYMYSKDFPDMHVGDVVRVRGEISLPLGTHRIKVQKRDDMMILSRALSVPTPQPISLLEVEDELIGDMVAVRGEVVSKKDKELIIESDDGDVQIIAKPTTPVAFTQTVGDVVEVAGILSKTRSGYRVLPRSNDDVSVVARTESSDPSSHDDAQRPMQIFAIGSLVPPVAGAATGIALSTLWSQRASLLLTTRRAKRQDNDSSADRPTY